MSPIFSSASNRLNRSAAIALLALASAGPLWGAAANSPIAQVNSGNPRYPFPQFLSYGPGRDDLAQVNPQGVPHAEMEQWTLDAYQIYLNELIVTSTVVGGVGYIRHANQITDGRGCPYDCSEGDGYALLAAAYMGDKTTFDGLWMRYHDYRLVKLPRYQDGVVPFAAYLYGNVPNDSPNILNSGSATDGDDDATMGILMAWYQWGDDSGVSIFGGGTFKYKAEAENMMRVYAAWSRRPDFLATDCRTESGDIGYDGYLKSGNLQDELTPWANGCPNPQYNGPNGPEFSGNYGNMLYVDYIAPSYFRAFGSFLTNFFTGAPPNFEVTQFSRAAASSDWLMSKLINGGPNNIPLAGGVSLSATNVPTWTSQGQGEQFRLGWRSILDYLWNGSPTTSWDPINHVVVAGGNTDELQAGQRYAPFLLDNQGAPWNNPCATFGGDPPGLSFHGPSTITWDYTLAGLINTTPPNADNLNWIPATGSTAAVAAQNFPLMAQLFRQCDLEWDVDGQVNPGLPNDWYLNSVPHYFHGFYRWLGMDILTGNMLNPNGLVPPPNGAPPANLKIYKSVDRTYAFTGDTLTYWLSYRNFASSAATGVQVTDALPPELGYVNANPAPSAAPGAGASGTVTWSLPNVPGLQNQNRAATLGGITLVATVLGSTGRFCNVASIACSNGTGWTSNEFPNTITPVMQRNCVDIVPQVMSLTQTAAPLAACAGDKVTFTINDKDNPGNWLNGGRPRVVVDYAEGDPSGVNQVVAAGNQMEIKIRLLHSADEPYIDYSNYRISYFLNDATNLPGSWGLQNTIYEGGTAGSVVVTQQALPPGPTWNQRVIVQFAPQLAATAAHLYNYAGTSSRIHLGGTMVLRAVWQMHNSAWSNVNWTDDWSADPAAASADDGLYSPVTPDWSAGDGTNVPVTSYDWDACETAPHQVTNLLVEEWDGYTWRRVFGNGPVAGRQLSTVVLSETLPTCMTFGGFISTPAGVTATAAGQNLTWTESSMNINEADTIQFWVTMGSCGGPATATASFAAQGEKTLTSSSVISLGAACGGTPTNSPSRTPSRTASPTPSPSATPSSSPTGTASPTPSRTATPTPSISPSPSATRSPSPTITATVTLTLPNSPTVTPSATPSATLSWSATASPSVTPSTSSTASPTRSPTVTASATRTASPLASGTDTPSASPSFSASPTDSPSATVTPTATDSPAYTATPTPSITLSFSPSGTPSATATLTATRTATLTATPTPSFTPTPTASGSATQSRTFSPSPSFSPSSTPTASPTVTLTRTPTATATITRTATPSASATATATSTRTASATPTVTLTATASATVTQTPTISPTFSVSPTKNVQFYQQPAPVLLEGIYPNPFSDTAKIYFNLRVAAHLRLQFYNVAGEPVYHLELDAQAGQNQALWQGINQVGARCASGVYILHLTAVGIDQTSGGFWANLVIMR